MIPVSKMLKLLNEQTVKSTAAEIAGMSGISNKASYDVVNTLFKLPNVVSIVNDAQRNLPAVKHINKVLSTMLHGEAKEVEIASHFLNFLERHPEEWADLKSAIADIDTVEELFNKVTPELIKFILNSHGHEFTTTERMSFAEGVSDPILKTDNAQIRAMKQEYQNKMKTKKAVKSILSVGLVMLIALVSNAAAEKAFGKSIVDITSDATKSAASSVVDSLKKNQDSVVKASIEKNGDNLKDLKMSVGNTIVGGGKSGLAHLTADQLQSYRNIMKVNTADNSAVSDWVKSGVGLELYNSWVKSEVSNGSTELGEDEAQDINRFVSAVNKAAKDASQ